MTTRNIVPVEQVKYKRGKHPNSLKNLRPSWKPGQTGNPRGYSLTSRLRDALEKPLEKPPEDAAVADQLVHNTLKGALDLVPTPFKEVWDRTEGKVPDKVNVDVTEGLKELIAEMRGLPELPEGQG
jgi:hypothetical protein